MFFGKAHFNFGFCYKKANLECQPCSAELLPKSSPDLYGCIELLHDFHCK